ncbi:MAG: hypothetical protein JSS62_00960 [Verrucomicrobia bacterium]|nr:hypothetical protein [Verrucomicrobiota bacterium]MBS0645257.1 hypothetical protein [Verrucomicrobiota bacterium]
MKASGVINNYFLDPQNAVKFLLSDDSDKDIRLIVQIFIYQIMSQMWQAFGDNLRDQAIRSREQHLKQMTYAARIKAEERAQSYRRVEQTSKAGESLPTSGTLKAYHQTQFPV